MNNNAVNVELIRTVKVDNQIGENVLWHPHQQQIWWTDVLGQCLYSLKLGATEQQDELTRWPVPENICSFAFVKDSEDFIVAFESGIAFYNVHTEQVKWIEKIEADREQTCMNDGRVDRNGRFWFGGAVIKPQTDGRGTGLYSVNRDLKIEQHTDGLICSNALCWSPDGNTMYHADTPKREIYAYDFDRQNGVIANKKVLIKSEDNMFPDGAIVDAEGMIWSARWCAKGQGNAVVRYRPNGEQIFGLTLPVTQVSCVGFAGPELALLCVTSAAVGLAPEVLAEQPLAGSLFIYQTNIKGIAEQSFEYK